MFRWIVPIDCFTLPKPRLCFCPYQQKHFISTDFQFSIDVNKKLALNGYALVKSSFAFFAWYFKKWQSSVISSVHIWPPSCRRLWTLQSSVYQGSWAFGKTYPYFNTRFFNCSSGGILSVSVDLWGFNDAIFLSFIHCPDLRIGRLEWLEILSASMDSWVRNLSSKALQK